MKARHVAALNGFNNTEHAVQKSSHYINPFTGDFTVTVSDING